MNIFFGPSNFWFIFMLIPLYLVAPILEHILKEKYLTEWMILLWLLGTIVLTSMKSWKPLLDGRVELAYVSVVPVYVGMFVSGAYYKRYGLKRKIENALLIIGFICLVVMSVGNPAGYFHNFTTPFCCMYAFAIFILSNRIFQKNKQIICKKIIRYVSNRSLGIYALHGLLINTLHRIWIPQKEYWLLQFVISFILVFCISLAISEVISRIPRLRKLVI